MDPCSIVECLRNFLLLGLTIARIPRNEAATALVLPFVKGRVMTQGHHPGLLLDVHVEVVTLDVWMSPEWFTAVWEKNVEFFQLELSASAVPLLA